MIMNVNDWHASFARMNRAAMLALAAAFIAVEFFEYRRKVFHNALQLHFGAIHQLVAIRAIPLECVERALGTRNLDDYPDRLSGTLWRMPHVLGKKKDLAFSDGNFQRRFTRRLDHSQRNITFQLIEKFFRGIIMIIAPLIRPADHGDHHLTVFPHLRIADRRLELLFIFIDPLLKIKSLETLNRRHHLSYFSGL